jgi:hypothetical protein
MNLITWHGAVVRLDGARNRLVQDPLWLTGAEGQELRLDPASGDPVQTPYGPFVLQPGDRPGVVRLRMKDVLLTAQPSRQELTTEFDEGQVGQSFMLLAPEDLADLRHILAHRWRFRPSGLLLEKMDIKIAAGFHLMLATINVDLSTSLPFVSHTRVNHPQATAYSPPPSFILNPGDDLSELIELADASPQGIAPAAQFELVRRRHPPPRLVATLDEFLASGSARLTVKDSEPHYMPPPLVIRGRDQELFVRALRAMPPPGIGFVAESTELRRERDRYVVLGQGCEGLVFDQDGTSGDFSLLEEAASLPAGFTRRGGRVWVQRSLLDEAPHLPGPLLTFYNARVHDYTDWLTGAMPALDLLSRHVPRNSRLLMPQSMARGQQGPHGPGQGAGHAHAPFNHREVMTVLGFARLPVLESDAEVVLAKDLIFLDRPTPEAIPASQLLAYRERVLKPFEGAGEASRRLFLKRADVAGNSFPPLFERLLSTLGFEPVLTDEVALADQIDLFRTASYVVGTRGSGLANVLFAPAGLRVVELMDERGFQPDIWRLCARLGHMYAFLGCPVQGQDTEQLLAAPDPNSFAALYATLEARRP